MIDTLQTSEKVSELFRVLTKVQASLSPVKKDGVNLHYKANYATLPAVLEVLMPVLEENGVLLLQVPRPIEPGLVNSVSVGLDTLIVHTESSEWLSFTMTLPLPKVDPQGVGIALAYMRRYSLLTIFSMSTEDGDGNLPQQKSGKSTGPAKAPKPVITAEGLKALAKQVYPDGPDEAALSKWAAEQVGAAVAATTFGDLNQAAMATLEAALKNKSKAQ